MYRKFIKRLIDIFISIILLLLTTPIILITILILFFVNKGQVLFIQDRPGYKEMKLRIIKFRTMNCERDKLGNLLSDSERLTSFGKFIREMSIDELPQLINVLKGDMSLVGPRPLLFEYIPLYNDEQKKRHLVKPGITGWAQVNGRNKITWTEKFKLDVYYIENISIQFDLRILWITFLKVIKREGINQSKDRPMMPFNGKN